MAASLLVTALLAGLVGGLHCAAMCGGFVTALAARDASAAALQPARTLIAHQAAYHAGRIASYSLLGAAFGALGSPVLDVTHVAPVQQALYVVANLLLLSLAFAMVLRTAGTSWLARAGVAAFGHALPRLRPLLRGSSTASRVGLGLVWGFVPCTLVYSVLPLALFAGGAARGAILMLVFGAATLPHLAGFGFLLVRSRALLGSRAFRNAAAAVIAVFAVVGLYRALFVSASLASGPFCLF
jgi:sulfite exporter TauE/SafE